VSVMVAVRHGDAGVQIKATAHEKTTLQRQITATDNQIDRLVYALYGLTDDEIRIVEGASREVKSG